MSIGPIVLSARSHPPPYIPASYWSCSIADQSWWLKIWREMLNPCIMGIKTLILNKKSYSLTCWHIKVVAVTMMYIHRDMSFLQLLLCKNPSSNVKSNFYLYKHLSLFRSLSLRLGQCWRRSLMGRTRWSRSGEVEGGCWCQSTTGSSTTVTSTWCTWWPALTIANWTSRRAVLARRAESVIR